jgi:DNA-binding MarR family transcriptional regulator
MKSALPFVRFVHLIKVLEELPFPQKLYLRYQKEYDYILSTICYTQNAGKIITVTDLLGCPILGSQPTANKRIKELVRLGLINMETGEDKRERMLIISQLGINYLRRCSEVMQLALSKN